jgi:hypothetical protein
MLQSQWNDLTAIDRGTLASFATMTTMVLEYADPATVVVPQAHRNAFMMTRNPPRSWFIGLARYFGDEYKDGFYHRGATVYDQNAQPMYHFQATVICMGPVMFYTLCSDTEALRLPGVPAVDALTTVHDGISSAYGRRKTHA